MIRTSHSWTTAIVLVHAAVALAHGAAHLGAGVGLSALGNAYVAVVIVAGPFAALALLRSGRGSSGAAVLAATMAGALAFGAWNHFVAAGADHVDHVAGPWRGAFRATAQGLVVTEVAGVVAGLAVLSRRPGAAGERSKEAA